MIRATRVREGPSVSNVLTTAAVEESERFAYWREVICAVYVELAAEPVDQDSFFGEVELSAWGDVRVSHVCAGGQVVSRRPDDQRSDCLLSIQVAGVGRVSQAGRTVQLGPGDAALYDSTRPYELSFPGVFEQLVVQFPREALIARGIHIESTVAKKCAIGSAYNDLATSFVGLLLQHSAGWAAEHRGAVGYQAVDLLAAALAETTGVCPIEESVATANRTRVLRYIAEHAHEQSLSVAGVAAHHGTSTRTLQKLFRNEELQLGERIRVTRVALAKRALRDPLRADHTIARIAADNGFDSPSHFSRVFKSVVGCTPSSYRHGFDDEESQAGRPSDVLSRLIGHFREPLESERS